MAEVNELKSLTLNDKTYNSFPDLEARERLDALEKSESAGDTLIGALPQTISGAGYYLLSEADTTITTDPGGEAAENLMEQVTMQSAKVTYADGAVNIVEATNGWLFVGDLTPLLKANQVYTWAISSVNVDTGTGMRVYAGADQSTSGTKIADISYSGSWVDSVNSATEASQVQMTWDGTSAYVSLFVGGSAGQSFELALYEGEIAEEGAEVLTLTLTAGEKKSMDDYVGKTFYTSGAVNLYKSAEAAEGDSESGSVTTKLPLAGKNVLSIGDSLTFGAMGTDPDTGGQLYPEKNYPQYFAEKTGCNVYNHGLSGANAVSYRDNVYPGIDFTVDYAVAIVMLGTNLGLDDTYGEAYADIIEQLAADTGGKTQIFLVTPPYNGMTSTGHAGYAKNANAVVKTMGETYCLPVIDAYYESGINQFNGTLYRPIDDLHFNDAGYERLAGFIANQVLSKYWL